MHDTKQPYNLIKGKVNLPPTLLFEEDNALISAFVTGSYESPPLPLKNHDKDQRTSHCLQEIT